MLLILLSEIGSYTLKIGIQSSNLTSLSSPVNESIGGALPCRCTNGSVSEAGGTPLITDGLSQSVIQGKLSMTLYVVFNCWLQSPFSDQVGTCLVSLYGVTQLVIQMK